jgi:hypothetical protein
MSTVTPQFRLFAEPLPWSVGQEDPTARIAEFVNAAQEALKKFQMGEPLTPNYAPDFSAMPVGLRWTMVPEFGFPRQPFRVYRRVRRYDMVRLIAAPFVVSGEADVPFPTEMYVLDVQVTLAAGQSLRLEPRDRNGRPLPGIGQVLSAGGTARFRSPFMASLHCAGAGTVTGVMGVSTDSVVNAGDWQLVQIVGLPFPPGVTTAYSGVLQGFASSPTRPDLASFQRLLIGYYLKPPVPDLGVAPLATPIWEAPRPDRYVQYLTTDPGSLLVDIQKCLEGCDDHSWNPADRQPAYVAERTVSGIHQAGVAPTTSGIARFPVVAGALLQISGDSFASLALGYGTYDFVPPFDPSVVAAVRRTEFDYKVEAEYVLRPSGHIELPGLFGGYSERHTFAALSEGLPAPEVPSDLRARTLRKNRPAGRDGQASEAVKISWRQPEAPQAWGLVVSRQAGQTEWLNTENVFSEKSYQPYLTRAPQGELPGEDTGRFHYVDTETPLPPYGSTPVRYFVAGLDIFGRWSAFREISHASEALPSQRPIINAVKLALPDPNVFPPPTPASVACRLEIEFSWEWSDRRAAQIQFAGQFYPARTTPSVAAPAGFSVHSSNAAHPFVTVTFDMNGNPTGTNVGSVYRLNEIPPDGAPLPPAPGLIQYRLEIPGVTAVFPSGAPHAVGYAVYVRGLERLRLPVTEYSPWSPPVTSEMPDPRKPAVVNLPAEVQWTALPDATKKARGRLSWPSAANALGYIVWEASETAIRFALDDYLKTSFPTDRSRWLVPLSEPHVVRATQLRSLLLQPEYAQLCAKAFTRYNRELVTATSVELELAGSSEVLTVFRVSSVNRANIESDKSAPVFFAVPRLNRPAAPNLSLKPNETGIEVQVLGNSPATTAGYRVYRTRTPPLSRDVGAKGLPVFREDNPAWQDFAAQVLNGPTLSGKKILDPMTARSWRPLYYQVTAVGTADPTRGIYAAESAGSSTRLVYWPPEGPPLLAFTGPVALPVLHLRTDLPFHAVELGKALIDVFRTDTIAGTGVVKTRLAQWIADALPPASPTPAAPRLENLVTTAGTGVTTFDLVLPAGVVSGIVRVTDPLGRSTSIMFP